MNDKMLYGFLIIGMLLIICPSCAERTERPKLSQQEYSKELPGQTSKPLEYVCVHTITPQSTRSQTVLARKTPSLIREFQRVSFTLGSPIFIRIFKESKELELWVKRDKTFSLFKTYPIAYFSGTLGPKSREGDKQAPEGFYYVSPSRMNPRSQFHLSFNIGYPNLYDQQHQQTGSAIMVHGNTVSIGCFAMTDRRIEEIYTIADHALNSGQPFFRVHIFPFRMTDENMERYATSPHLEFWNNLQEGYKFFEKVRRPPNVTVEHQQYTFEYKQREA